LIRSYCGILGSQLQARHERCSQELKDLEKQLALLEEQNKMYKLKRDFRAAQVSYQTLVCFLIVLVCIKSVT